MGRGCRCQGMVEVYIRRVMPGGQSLSCPNLTVPIIRTTRIRSNHDPLNSKQLAPRTSLDTQDASNSLARPLGRHEPERVTPEDP